MGRYKCACNCEHSNDSDVKYFKFPLYNPRKLKKWLVNMKWTDWTPSRFSVLCINHFEEQHVDRTGKSVTLKEDAVPTIFPPAADTQKRKRTPPVNPRVKRNKPPAVRTSQTSATTPPPPTPLTAKQSPAEEPAGDKDPTKSDKWRIVVDEDLMKIESFPHFFHGDYCVPQAIHWAPDDNGGTECEDPEKVIEVTEPWQWLGLDVRGPLPQTLNGHRYILSVTDYFSKWVEAVPMLSCLPAQVVDHIVDIIGHFGYPLRILSRLPQDLVLKINRELNDQLKAAVELVVYHQQTGSADLTTQQLIDRMVDGLVEEHAEDWDVFLPAKVFSLCFKEHAETKERPFSVLCCKGPEPVQCPRGLDYTNARIQESAFVVR